jgi:nucleoside-diphosphate-sugar epimerase
MAKIKGNILVLGAAGKMGPSLCVLAARAIEKAGTDCRITAVSRFSDPETRGYLENNGIHCHTADLLDKGQLGALPDAENIIYMAGKKFGTKGAEYLTWAMNALVPSFVADRYIKSNIVVFSSGNIYPFMPVCSGGADETCTPVPVGEYAMSCLARERVFEYYSRSYGLNCFFLRLNYAIALRYGVLHDISRRILDGEAVSLDATAFNCIWQRDANEIAIRALLRTRNPPEIYNVTGPETVSVRTAAAKLGALLGKVPTFEGNENPRALLSNAGRAHEAFGYPSVSLESMIRRQAEWFLNSGSSLCKATHFEERDGQC